MLEYKPFRDIVSFDETTTIWKNRRRLGAGLEQGKDARIIKAYSDILDGIRKNNLKALTPQVEEIGKLSKNQEISKLSYSLVNELKDMKK
jgi:hypothetical protein